MLVIVPGWFSGMAMTWLTGLPRSHGTMEPVVGAITRSLLGLVALELVTWARGPEFGWFLLTPLLSGQILEFGAVEVVLRYILLLLVVVVVPTGLRWLGQRPFFERRLGQRTAREASLHRLCRYHPASRYGAPLVRLVTIDGTVEGWLQWSSDGTEQDQAVIVRAEGSHAVTWVPVSSVVHYTILDPDRRDLTPLTPAPVQDTPRDTPE